MIYWKFKKLINELNPDSLIVVFDSETSKNNNLEIDNEYKANRIDYTIIDEENPFSQLPLIKKALNYLNITYIEIENYEADEIKRVTNLAICYLVDSFNNVLDFKTILNNYENRTDIESKIVHTL